jgi:hypothetical protein
MCVRSCENLRYDKLANLRPLAIEQEIAGIHFIAKRRIHALKNLPAAGQQTFEAARRAFNAASGGKY